MRSTLLLTLTTAMLLLGACTPAAPATATNPQAAAQAPTAISAAPAGATSVAPGGNSLVGTFSDNLLSLGKNRKIVFLADGAPSDSFWGTIQRGALDAARLYNISLDYRFTTTGVLADYADQIGIATATQPAAMAVVIRDPDANTANICAAAAAGIKIASYNITQGGKVGSCISGFVGQDFVAAGALVGQQIVERGGLKAGDLVLEPVEQPTASYAKLRAQGVNSVLDPLGVKHEIIQAGSAGDAEALQNQTQWLIGHPTVRAIIPLGGTPFRNAKNAVSAAGLDISKIAIAGFDISKPVTDMIANEEALFAVTQEPYIQGFQTVAQLALYIDFGIEPFSINTGAGLTDKTNVAQVAALAGIAR